MNFVFVLVFVLVNHKDQEIAKTKTKTVFVFVLEAVIRTSLIVHRYLNIFVSNYFHRVVRKSSRIFQQ